MLNSPTTDIHATNKPEPKKHRAWRYILNSGINGFTENEILRYCRLSSGRNYPTELERLLGIRLERIDEPNPDGIGSHYRYRINSNKDARRIIGLFNTRTALPLSSDEINEILSLYSNAE